MTTAVETRPDLRFDACLPDAEKADLERGREAGEMVAAMVASHRYEGAHAAIERYERMHRQATLAQTRTTRPLDRSLAELGLPQRVSNRLEEHGIHTIEDLLESSEADLLAIPSVGAEAVATCKRLANDWLGRPANYQRSQFARAK